ncbi:HWE histidine kinase domain-containing protein [Belnapia rosea]|uniref:histidine kinase n=1 Tax=Belnapia rosea TaxID=938405 RepID=A0A1G6NTD9_9PROT|nr:HWE histidine kinase domain-containing protein [Belnapia rosea]SDC71203.1 PAS domain S-box-containing protein [Belnapia rosea]
MNGARIAAPLPKARTRQPGSSRAMGLLLPAAIALPLLVTASGAWLTWRQVWREAEQEVAHAADASAEYARRIVDGLLLRIDRANDALVGLSDAEIEAREEEVHGRLRRASATGPHGNGQRAPYIFVYDREGRVLVTGNIFPAPRGQAVEREEITTGLRGPDAPPVLIGLVQYGRVTGEPFFTVIRRREEAGNGLPEGSYDGVIAASVYTEDVSAALRRLASKPTGDVLSLIRTDGLVLARSLPIAPGVRIAEGSPLLDALRRGADRASGSGPSRLDGVNRLVAYRRVEGYPVHAAAARPHTTILRRWAMAVLPLLASGVPAALALLALALLVRRGQRDLAAANAGLERHVAARTAALSESEARFRAAVEGAPFPMMLHAEDGTVLALSRSWTGITGYAAEDLPTHAAWARRAFGPERAAARQAALAEEFASGLPADPGELEVRTRQGERRFWEFHDVPVGALPDGRRLRLSAAMDTTDRRRVEERQTLLAREVDHRAKNALAVVQAALRLTPREDAGHFAAAIEARVAALARAQGLLAETNWRGADLRDLAAGALATFLPTTGGTPDAPRAELEGPPLQLAATAVQPISLVLHELATNAVKYGALSTPGGRVRLSWRSDTTAGLLRIRWQEEGGPALSGTPGRRGFGSRILGATIRGQLGGMLEEQWPPSGILCDLALPLARAVAETPEFALAR